MEAAYAAGSWLQGGKRVQRCGGTLSTASGHDSVTLVTQPGHGRRVAAQMQTGDVVPFMLEGFRGPNPARIPPVTGSPPRVFRLRSTQAALEALFDRAWQARP